MKGAFQLLPQIQLHLAHPQDCRMCAVSWIRRAGGYRLFCNRCEPGAALGGHRNQRVIEGFRIGS